LRLKLLARLRSGIILLLLLMRSVQVIKPAQGLYERHSPASIRTAGHDVAIINPSRGEVPVRMAQPFAAGNMPLLPINASLVPIAVRWPAEEMGLGARAPPPRQQASRPPDSTAPPLA
jgi:hypothetical protein